MGLLDITSKVITEYKADTSDHKAKIKELQGEEKKLAQEQLKAAEERNKGLESWIDRLGKAGLALNAAGMAINVAKNAWKSYSDHLRLSAAAGSADIEKLRKASLGLRSEHDLLAFAAKAQNGAFKLTQEQMEMTQRAMVGLTRAGFEQEEVTKKVTDAIVKLEGGGLKDFGIQVRSGTTDAEKFANIMTALSEKAKGVDSSTLAAGESVQQMGVSMQDSFDKINQAIGEMVNSLTPLIAGLAAAIKHAQELVDRLPKGTFGFGSGGAVDLKPGQVINKDLIAKLRGSQADGYFGGSNEQLFQFYKPYLDMLDGIAAQMDYLDKHHINFESDSVKAAAAGASRFSDFARRAGTDTAGPPLGFSTQGLGASADSVLRDMYGRDAERGVLDRIEQERTGALTADWQKRLGEQQAKKTSFLEGTFGKLEDFNAYATAFSTLTGAVSAGLTAWIDGSMSAGQAIKKFLADSLKGLASSMAVEALKHGAYALGSLAFGDVRGAGQHAAAAGAFALGAGAAAAAAKGLGGSGGDAPRGGTGTASGNSGGYQSDFGNGSGQSRQGTGERGRDVIVVYEDPFAYGSPNQRRERARRAIDRAKGGTGWADE